MILRNTTTRWGAGAQLLHWLIVALIIVQFVIAEIAQGLPLGPDKVATLARHKSVGITILALALLRLVWRAVNPTPTLPATSRPWERTVARATHAVLYGLLFAMPLSGWMMSSARNFPVSWFGLVQLPDLVRPSKPLYEQLHETHEVLFVVLVAVAILHVLAALKHHFILKNDVLRRMLPMLGALALGFGAAGLGEAAAWHSEAAGSTLRFEFDQAGARSNGSFGKFQVQLDLGAPPTMPGRLDVRIDTTSIDTQDEERDGLLRGAELFDTAKFPAARFVATNTIKRGGDRYEAAGQLTIRNVTRPLTVPFVVQMLMEGGRQVTRMRGAVTIRRLDFGVGQGDWKSTEWVGNDVKVSFDLRLTSG